MPPLHEIPVDVFSEAILELHRASHELPVRAFQARAFDCLRRLAPFDSGLLATGTIHSGVEPLAHDVYLDRQSADLMASWECIKHLDKVSFLTVSNPGRTVAFATDDIYAGLPQVLEHCERFGIRHVMSTAAIAARAGSYVVLSLYRREDVAFSEAERTAVELVIPHLVESGRQAHLTDLFRNTRAAPHQSALAAAMVNRRGIVIEAEPSFVDLLGRRFPDWQGPQLPPELARRLSEERGGPLVVGRLVCFLDWHEDLALMRIRNVLPVDTLSARERQVAELFASGESSAEIGAKLAIATNTVRVHLSRIYDKLGVVNKAELASMLAGVE